MDLGRPPDTLRSLQPYLTIYKQFIKKDPLISYYALKHAVSEGIGARSRDAAVKNYLGFLLDVLEAMKSSLKGDEGVTNEMAGGARVEEAGLKLFTYADTEDKSGRFHKNMIKAFFTSCHLLSIVNGLEEEVDEEIERKRKYAMWKAVEIDRCLKNGIQPTSGGPGEDPTSGGPGEEGLLPDAEGRLRPAAEEQPKPTPKPRSLPPETLDPPPSEVAAPLEPAVGRLPPEVISEAQKKCKFASSALDYDDVAGAVEYLTEALKMLKK